MNYVWVPSETVSYFIQPGYEPHRTWAERAVGQLCAVAWDIKNRGLTAESAEGLFFGIEFAS